MNPVARTDKSSPIYGMPILNVDMAHNVIVVKRGKGAGYSGIENALFYRDNCRMLYGQRQQHEAQQQEQKTRTGHGHKKTAGRQQGMTPLQTARRGQT